MPLFMDRHDLMGATAEEVAAAHARDVASSPSHGVEFLAYWFDAASGGAFCFAKAPAATAVRAVHEEAHGMVPSEIISVSEDSVLRFLGKLNSAEDEGNHGGAFRTILFTDLEGSTSLLQDLGQAAYMVLLTEHDLIIRRALVATRGREVKHTGDGIMAAFDDVARALECAVLIQDGFAQRTAAGATPPLRVRIGMAAGEPVDRNDDLFGATVNLASRICDAAQAGQTLVSDIVHELGTECGFSLREAEARVLKGYAVPTRMFELLQARAAAARKAPAG